MLILWPSSGVKVNYDSIFSSQSKIHKEQRQQKHSFVYYSHFGTKIWVVYGVQRSGGGSVRGGGSHSQTVIVYQEERSGCTCHSIALLGWPLHFS